MIAAFLEELAGRPLATAALVILSCLTHPIEVLKLIFILLTVPLEVVQGIARSIAPSFFERDVSDDVVFITGAASGLGKLMAKQFAELGATVVMIDKDSSALTLAQADICDGMRDAIDHEWRTVPYAFAADISDREQTYTTMRQAAARAGNCTILINNAGVVTGKKLMDAPDDGIELSFRVNVLAHCWTIKSVLPSMMLAKRGHIVTIASSAGLIGVPGLSDYCASKVWRSD